MFLPQRLGSGRYRCDNIDTNVRLITPSVKLSALLPLSAVARPTTAWLLFVLTLQGQQPAARMRVWRALKALGAAVLRDGVYLLPNRTEFVAELQRQAEDVLRSAGSAQLLEVDARDVTQETEFRRLFDRTADYQGLIKQIRKLREQIVPDDRGTVAAQLTRVRRDFEAIVGQDFFPGEAASQTRRALEELTATFTRVTSPDEPHTTIGQIRRLDANQYVGRTWATRRRPWADRLASAWLIRRFIDPRARFVWLKSPEDCPKRALGFDFDGAAFTHIGGKVTFEVIMESFGLEADPGLRRVGALIHYLDVGGLPVAEAAGIEAVLRGAQSAFAADDALLAEAAKLFELLYISYSKQSQADA